MPPLEVALRLEEVGRQTEAQIGQVLCVHAPIMDVSMDGGTTAKFRAS